MTESHRWLRSLLVMALLCIASALEAQRATWRMDTTPLMRLGASDAADEVLAAPVSATRLPNGNVVVGDVGEWALREYSPQGRVVKRYGRKGRGPGEISYLFYLFRCGDSLVTKDLQGPVSVFDLKGTFIRAFHLKTMPYRMAANAKMHFVAMGWEANNAIKGEVNRSPADYWLARADTNTEVQLGKMPGAERIGPLNYPLGREPRVAIGLTTAYVALGDSMEVRRFDLQGRPMTSLVDRFQRVSATHADLEAAREREIAMMGERSRQEITNRYAQMPLARYLPATRELVVDRDDNLWVEHFPRAASPTVRWTVFSPQGQVRATIDLPAVFDVYEVGRDYILGRYIDPNTSVPEVRLYRLRR